MPVISAIRHTEAWSGTTIAISVVLVIVAVWLIFSEARRFVRGDRRR